MRVVLSQSEQSIRGFTLFDTAIGRCGIAWSGVGVCAVQLPEGTESQTRARLTRQRSDTPEMTPPTDVGRAIDGIVSLLAGERVDLSFITLDLTDVPEFHRRVYDVARTIPPGATVTYGDIAARLGAPGSAQAVGQALGRNPFVIVVPCHRVLATGGKTGGFSGPGGVVTKMKMLAIEGAHVGAGPGLFDGPA